jgi:hypothetical protein
MRHWSDIFVTVALAAVAAAAGCGRKPDAAARASASGSRVAGAELPASREGFLAELAPRPSRPLRVVYDVEGPAEASGSLALVVEAGGYRREDWTIAVPVPGQDPVEVSGTTIQTPDRVWSGTADDPGEIAASPLGELADGYVALDNAQQRKVVASVRRWYADLREARLEHPGDVEELLGVRCLVLEVAGQTLCLWEELGIPLRYEGDALTLVATKIDREPEVDRSVFALPERARRARTARPPSGLSAPESLERLVAGDYGPLVLLLEPDLRLSLTDTR